MPNVKSNVSDLVGPRCRFELRDIVERRGSKYALFLPVQCGGASLLPVILAVIEHGDGSIAGSYRSVTDAEELAGACEAFREENARALGLA